MKDILLSKYGIAPYKFAVASITEREKVIASGTLLLLKWIKNR